MLSLTLPIWRDQQTETVWLEAEQFEQAAALSTAAIGEAQQWQVYLQALAYAGFADWLRDRTPALQLDTNRCTLLQPAYASSLSGVCRLTVQGFRLCLVVIDHPLAQAADIPRAAFELPDFQANFYVLVEVQEEQAVVFIRGFISHQALQAVSLTAQQDWTYGVPLALWDLDPDRLLLQLTLRQPEPMQQSASAAVSTASLTLGNLAACLQELRDTDGSLWQVFTWPQGRYLLSQPQLLTLMYQWRRQPTAALALRLQEALALLTQPAVNVAGWLTHQLDALAQRCAIYFAPSGVPAFRSIDKFEQAITALRQQGLTLPETAVHAYQDIDWQGLPLRLCTLTWASDQHWSMLILIGMQTGAALPDALALRISKVSELICEEMTELDDPFLYAQVSGTPSDRFLVTLTLPEGPVWMSVPYQFQRDDKTRSISFEVNE
ncbi:MAG: DUF1822 family protein [Leptolyngbya sp. SIO4C1]|nr:DUF1822 family protein [Leptolyngbya sp. SIO4C1]